MFGGTLVGFLLAYAMFQFIPNAASGILMGYLCIACFMLIGGYGHQFRLFWNGVYIDSYRDIRKVPFVTSLEGEQTPMLQNTTKSETVI
jgi:hypothetical protein